MQNIVCKNSDMSTLLNDEIENMRENDVINRIWNRDYTLWSDSPAEISNRLDWLNIVDEMMTKTDEIIKFSEKVCHNYNFLVLLGMGGSSLAPEVFSKIFGSKEGYPQLFVIDTTHPEQIMDVQNAIELDKTLFITSTKSGGTVETISLMKYFYTLLTNTYSKEKAGEQFIAITDPGSGLEDMAKELGFSKIFLNNPDIGGRFSALSMFGLVPAALLGINIDLLLERTKAAMELSKLGGDDTLHNVSAELGVLMGVMAKNNLNKMTVLTHDDYIPIGAWIEQLVAESTGKIGKGVLPVVDDTIENMEHFSDDRYYVLIEKSDEISGNADLLCKRGKTTFQLNFTDLYDLGAHFFYWEFATAVAGWSLKLQPFDQPDVESAKVQARAMVKTFIDTGNLPEVNPDYEDDEVKILGEGVNGNNISTITDDFITSATNKKDSPYISVQAYVNMNENNQVTLKNYADMLLKKYQFPVTVGFGPRFLHSTGQLHKGDDNSGIFIQLIEENMDDINIPDEAGKNDSGISFGTLITAQSLGDRQALINNDRSVLRIIFKSKMNL
ncbi:MAG: hypothetical protein SCALA702_27200 [Melioribacteraceae bacterium]|nr:MAG: hypothetical protein SCALA702_27200 [Melioribacteraceae bacterium]